ncbi:beta-hexosaminidase-like [Oculina patagonica]
MWNAGSGNEIVSNLEFLFLTAQASETSVFRPLFKRNDQDHFVPFVTCKFLPRLSLHPIKGLGPNTTRAKTGFCLRNDANNLKLYFDVLSPGRAQITLSNRGPYPIRNGKWAIYICLLGIIQEQQLTNNPAGYVLPGGSNLKITHLSGCLYQLEPLSQFQAIAPGDLIKVQFNTTLVRVRSNLTPNWYIASEGLEPRTIANTAGEDLSFVFSFDKLTWDSFGAPSATDLGRSPYMVIPTPDVVFITDKTKKVSVEKDWRVYGEKGLENEVNFLAKKFGLKVSSGDDPNTSKTIKLSLMPPKSNQRFSSTAHESYQLQVDESMQNTIIISGGGPTGVFYGVQTLLALMDDQGLVPQVSIKDSPRFSYRGLMVDVGRNFMPKREILKLLDAMAMYKMNKFHFHLSENEGWRLEIPGLEELAQIGSKRCHDLQEKTCILSQLGSGPDTSTSGTGYYTTEDYIEILRHATARHIQVIPELDFPGHSHAAIKSMIVRHDRLMQQGRPRKAKEFILNEFHDQSRYFSVQHFTDGVVNPCLNSTYAFLDHVISALVSMHRDIQPLTLYHFGGDEVAWGVWKGSPACDRLANASSKSEEQIKKDLIEYFIKKVSQITEKNGLDFGGWGDAFFGGKDDLTNRSTFENKDVYAYYWSMSNDTKNLGVTLLGGYKVVLTPPDCLYLDHPYEPDFEERGLYWATDYTDTQKVFEYSPNEHIEYENSRNGLANLLGIEGSFWGETVRTADQMFSMLFPRLLALAERAWHKASWENIPNTDERDRKRKDDWVWFANTVAHRELGRLDEMGVTYHVTPPGARMIDGKLQVKTALLGVKIEYSTDEGVTWNDVTKETKVNGEIRLRSRSADHKRYSRLVKFEAPNHPK